MEPQQYADQIARTAERYEARTGDRAEIAARLDEGGVLAADSPERVASRLERLQVEPAVVEAIVTERLAAPIGGVVGEPPPPMPAMDERSALVLERLIGNSNLIDVAFLEAGYLAGRAVGRIEVTTPDGRSFGTGSLVSPRLLLTNNHVLASRAEAANARVQFDFQLGLDGGPLVSAAFAFEPDAFFVTDGQLDYTLVAVAERAGSRELAEFGWNQMIEQEGKVLLGEPLNIIQHPSGEPKQLALRENKLIDLLDEFVHYETDTAPGSSGAPVFSDDWKLVALHHSGVPKVDDQGRILALNGDVWQTSMGEGQVAWIANEGARVSRIVRHLKDQILDDRQRVLRSQVLELTPPQSAAMGVQGTVPATVLQGGQAAVTIPLQISVSLGPAASGASVQAAKPAAPAPAPADSAEVTAALAELERSRRRPYYSESRDEAARASYYAAIPEGLDPQALFERLGRLVTETHTRQPAYKPSQLVYPWVDLHPDHQLRSIYSGKTFPPEAFIREDAVAEVARAERLRELFVVESMGEERLAAELDALEAAFPFNCEHVVPQSWFQKREPMRGDLHHLFACEWGCNSFRGNTPYFDFADFEEVVREACGKRETGRFEPASGKGAAARAVLYFLLRYPRVVSDAEFARDRLGILLGWHEDDRVDRYERHRNQAIFELQGNRNPLIDHPEWADRIAFGVGIG